jgi:hypothetical protein
MIVCALPIVSVLLGCVLYAPPLRPSQPIRVTPRAIPLPTPRPVHAEPAPVPVQGQVRHTDKPIATLPPIEYDHVFRGKTLVVTRANKEEMEARCPKAPPKMATLGCAPVRTKDECHIIVANDDILEAAGYTAKIMRRHEEAHCVSWPADHPGARVQDLGGPFTREREDREFGKQP